MGLALNTFIGHFYSGNKELFQKAKEEGECYEDKGRWYTTMSFETNADKVTDAKKAKKSYTAEGVDFNDVVAGVLSDMEGGAEWLVASCSITGSSSKQKPDAQAPPSDSQMRMLQESFDAVTRMTMAIKKMATEIMGSLGSAGFESESAKSIARRGLQLLKELVAPSQLIEELLVTDRCDLTAKRVEAALEQARVPYKRVVDFYSDLATIYAKRGGKMSKKQQLACA